MTTFSLFEYRYRDASNYKQNEEILLVGEVCAGDVEAIQASMNADCHFIPELVGLESLQHRFAELGSVPSNQDHVWHEFVSLRVADVDDLNRLAPSGSKEGLVAAFRKVKQWDEARSPIYEELRDKLVRNRLRGSR